MNMPRVAFKNEKGYVKSFGFVANWMYSPTYTADLQEAALYDKKFLSPRNEEDEAYLVSRMRVYKERTGVEFHIIDVVITEVAAAEVEKDSAEEIKFFDIWSEGYMITGGGGTAHFHGTEKGTTFQEACNTFARFDPEFERYYDSVRMAYWGCKLYDNASDARKSFG
jgi:hypothetical protein